MGKYKFFGSIAFLLITFSLYILSLLKTFPLVLSIPLLFGAILFLVLLINERKRFKGFKP
ncbi:hypothetical protein OH784_06145 [Ectobacillus funiculus]|uniref:hypothetical protein n=1 Tax=Bacillus sp. OTU530 TaxID=3043862 RepID=UPI00101DCCE2|nr:hypothetical protein [Ectobacillus funiculus]